MGINYLWLKLSPKSKIDKKREAIRQKYVSADTIKKAEKLLRDLDTIDKELSKRAWGKEKPHAPSRHREHGWYLPNDDD